MSKLLPLLLLLTLPACGTMGERLSEAGKPPKLSAIENPQMKKGYQPVSLPMPEPMMAERQPNSLWRSGSRAFFKDQRANKVGDILTVNIQIDDKAELENTSSRSRNGSETMGAPKLLGYEGELGKILPDTVTPASLLSVNGTSTNKGTGAINRTEKINLQVAAMIEQLLPNGNMVLSGSQEVRVNNEVRVLQMSGVVRPEDITSSNTISYEKIAEARISYGGRGIITDVQRPRYGTEVLDIVSPF